MEEIMIGSINFRYQRSPSWTHYPVVSDLSNSRSDSPDTPDGRLLRAIVKFKDCEKIEQAIEDGADVNLKDADGDFPLIKAENPYHIYEIVAELIRHKVDVNAQNKEGTTALQFYLQNWVKPQMDRVALLLLKNGADINIKDVRGNTAWHVLIDRGYAYCGGVEEGDYDDNEYVCDEDDHSMFLEILKYQTDINIRDGRGRTALHIAGKIRDLDLVRILAENGADPNTPDSSGSKPIYEAIGDFDMTKALIDVGAKADFSNPSEVSHLHVRLLESDLEFLPLFIEPCTVNSPGVFNRTILHLAASLGCRQHIEHLFAIPGIDVNAKDVFGDTCLHFATQIGKTDIIEDILKAGADVKILNNLGQSICHVAAIYGHYSLIESFLLKGLSPDAVDIQGRNCLHYAVMYRHADVVERLLKVTIDVEIKDCKGKRPMDYLLEVENNSAIAQMLRRETAVVRVLSADVDPPYDQATRGVPHLAEIPTQPGIGSVWKLKDFDMSSFVALIKGKVEELIGEVVPECPEAKVLGCGSSFEGSKVVIPDELDFVLELFSTGNPMPGEHFGFQGYEGMKENENIFTDNMSYLVWLWDKLMIWWSKHQEATRSQPCESVPQFQMPLPPQRHPDRTSCITWVWMYNEGSFRDFPVSIDFVPAVKDYIKDCYVVPKTPREINDPDEGEDRKRGRVSHPPFEVEYLSGLDERLLNVFITAKCLRTPEVCCFKIKNKDGDLVPVKEFVTSYRLKTAFMHLTPVFQNSKMSHGKMVLMVYELLEKGLKQGNLPAFFLDSLNVLDGSSLNHELCLLAANKMTKFASYLYERDVSEEKQMIDMLQEQNVLLRMKVDILVEKLMGNVKLPFYLQPAIELPNQEGQERSEASSARENSDIEGLGW